MGALLPWVASGILPFATVAIEPVPFQLSAVEWMRLCPVVITTGEMRARGMQLKPVHQPLPEYPRTDENIGRPGTVVLWTRIDTEGKVVDVELVRAWHPNFVAGAIDAVRQWRFKKVLVDDKPTCVLGQFEVAYRTQSYR